MEIGNPAPNSQKFKRSVDIQIPPDVTGDFPVLMQAVEKYGVVFVITKFGYIYILTPRGITEKAALTSNFLKRKHAEYEAMKAEIDSLSLELQSSQEEKSYRA